MPDRPPPYGRTLPQPLPEAPEGEFQLQIIGPNPGVRRLDEQSLTVGSGPGNDLRLTDDPYVSANHLVITRERGALRVRDVGASNMTWVLAPGGRETGLPVDGIPRWLPGYGLRIGATELWLQELPAPGQQAAGFHGIVGESAATQALVGELRRWGPVNATVILEGRTGTGKELAARALHAESPRSKRPFIPVNCGAIPREAIEDELFGHVRGAFTGADAERLGHFREAHGGTLFLDEVHKLSLEAQVALLRALENHEVVPRGSSRPLKVDVRVIAATGVSLGECVAEGRFLPDLFHRLQVGLIRLPALVDRPGDLRLLAQAFLRKHGSGGERLSAAALDKLATHTWPGNVRELDNVMQRGVVKAGPGGELRPEHIEFHLIPARGGGDTEQVLHLAGKTWEECQRHIWLAAYRRSGNKVGLAWKALGLSKATGSRFKKEWGPHDGADEE